MTFTSKTTEIHHFVRFVMNCIITTCSVECFWHSSDETVHYKSDETVNSKCLHFYICNYVTYDRFYKHHFLHL